MEFEVCEIFPSIQGEGVSTGVPTVFIRFFGCNLSCSWCDTDYSRTGDHHSSMDDRYLIDEVISHSISNVCLTGGEPLLQLGIIDLVEELIMRGLNVDVETNGSMPVSDMILKCPGVRLIMDVKTPSSGMAGSFLHENLGHLMYDDTLKFIIEGEGDLDFALAFIMEHRPYCNIIFTPCSNRGGEMVVEGLLRAVMSREAIDGDLHRHPLSRARVMLQTHRVIWGDKKGV